MKSVFLRQLSSVVVLTALLAGCATPPSSTVLSRLPEGQPGAVATSAQPLTPEERQSYDAIDKQVLREQDEEIAAEAAARAYDYAPATIYGGYYGGGYPGWGSGFGYGYHPGWGWGW